MLEYILLVLGILLLVKGADYLVDGSVVIANKYKISKLIIGLTIVSIGTSLPELVVNMFAAISGSGDVALGTIIGSNISNILLVLGLVMIVSTINIDRKKESIEMWFSLGAALLLFIVALFGFYQTGSLTFVSGVVLLIGFGFFIWYAVKKIKNKEQTTDQSAKNYFLLELKEGKKIKKDDEFEDKKLKMPAGMLILLGILALYLGGKWTVDSVITIAQTLGIDTYIISLVVIAIGTSLPELITTVKAAMKKESGIALGNIVGSNVVNIVFILGLSSLLRTITLPSYALIDIGILCIASFLLLAFALNKKARLQRWQGIVFVSLYVLYVIYLILR